MLKRIFLATIMLILLVSLFACGSGNTSPANPGIKVLATTSIVADVVAQVGGKTINLSVLLPVGTDPHEFSPRPQDAAALADAGIIFANGAGLEGFLPPLLDSAGATGKVVEVSTGITLQPLPGGDASTGDPHTWMDPNNVIIWTQNIAAALAKADPAHASDYQANATAYAASLRDLDAWVRAQVDQVPPANRILVSDHAVLGYFATRYGVRAIFVTEAASQTLADQVAADTGIQAVWLYHASLTDASGPAATYLDFVRYNVNAIVKALK
jgi:manganese/iron transport system substrate-binding protein